MRTRNCSSHKLEESGLISKRRGSLMGFLELQWEPGVYSPIMVGVAIKNFYLFQRCQDSCLVTMDTSGMQKSSVYPKSTRDEAHFPSIGSIAIPHSTSYRTSGLTSFRTPQKVPETPVSRLEEHQFQYSTSRKAPCTPYHLEMRADSLSSNEEVSHLSTSTSRGVFP